MENLSRVIVAGVEMKRSTSPLIVFAGLLSMSGCVTPSLDRATRQSPAESVAAESTATQVRRRVIIPKVSRDAFDVCADCTAVAPTPKTMVSESVTATPVTSMISTATVTTEEIEGPMSAVRVRFAIASDELNAEGLALLKNATRIAYGNYKVKVVAQTDGSGLFEFNKRLAKRRADRVIKQMAAHAATVPSKVEIKLEPCCLSGRLPPDADRRVVDVLVVKES
jgi:outer membrane protein OmpA-like peptidoglycan-associated protein